MMGRKQREKQLRKQSGIRGGRTSVKNDLWPGKAIYCLIASRAAAE